MAKADTMTTRAPRGSKPVSAAFFTALESIPDASRAAVAKAALAMIRDEIKNQRDKLKAMAAAAKAKAKASKPVVAKRAAKKAVAAKATAPVKRRPRKPAAAAPSE
jgi:hypothetical protein